MIVACVVNGVSKVSYAAALLHRKRTLIFYLAICGVTWRGHCHGNIIRHGAPLLHDTPIYLGAISLLQHNTFIDYVISW